MYINAIGSISPQNTTQNEAFLEEVVLPSESTFLCQEPNYKDLIPARRLRRMSRTIRMGIYAAKLCLKESSVEVPDAILVGTGLGCMEDTERFLGAIYENDEGLVSPTQFIQSTHNTVSSAIALMLKCYNYNFTYVHRGFSFESALFDALMQAEEQPNYNALVGGIDEITDLYYNVTNRLKYWTTNQAGDKPLSDFQKNNHLPGEGAHFFMLGSEASDQSYAKLKGLQMLYKPQKENIEKEIHHFLEQYGKKLEEIDLICMGMSGNEKRDAIYYPLAENLTKTNNIAYFKHLCGEYKTASSFGLWLAAQMLHKQKVPTAVQYNECNIKSLNNVLIYNNYSDINHSLFLLERV